MTCKLVRMNLKLSPNKKLIMGVLTLKVLCKGIFLNFSLLGNDSYLN